jgi:hypothetical protein
LKIIDQVGRFDESLIQAKTPISFRLVESGATKHMEEESDVLPATRHEHYATLRLGGRVYESGSRPQLPPPS